MCHPWKLAFTVRASRSLTLVTSRKKPSILMSTTRLPAQGKRGSSSRQLATTMKRNKSEQRINDKRLVRQCRSMIYCSASVEPGLEPEAERGATREAHEIGAIRLSSSVRPWFARWSNSFWLWIVYSRQTLETAAPRLDILGAREDFGRSADRS